ncbi:hypothetical protein SUDANB140_01078 [Streptomyces sp. enrichment culture]
MELDEAEPATARDTLAHWRTAVARWARQPSRPVPADVRERLRAAWADDLDDPAVLRILREVENASDLPDGARFEICAYADRFLGLQLTRDVGAPSSTRPARRGVSRRPDRLDRRDWSTGCPDDRAEGRPGPTA